MDEVAPHSHIETVYWNGGGTGAAHPAAVEAGDPRKYGGLVARTENTGGGQAHNNLATVYHMLYLEKNHIKEERKWH